MEMINLYRSITAGFLISIASMIYANCQNHILGAFLFSLSLIAIIRYDAVIYTGSVGYCHFKLNDIVAIVDEVKRDNRISAEAIREEVVKKLKGELATRDFVRAEINQVRTEIAEVSNKFNILEQKVKFYAIGLGFLMIILQPKVFEFITALFK